MSCSSDDQSDKECPLCMEVLEIDDIDFYPCKCEYQICRFCWHRLRNDENGLCPACRQPYPEDPVNFKPLSSADLQRIKDEKKMKQQAEKMRISESRKHLANYRVLQKNLVYVVGLSARFASEEILRKQEFFGRFGKIQKIVLGTTPTSSLPSHLSPSHTAYITYNKVDEALRAIQGVNNSTLDGRCVKASLGTTKYCSSFLRSQSCGKPECMYLHDTADNDISFTKEDMHAGKHSDYERRLIEMMVSKRQALERRQPAQINVKPTTYYDQTGRDVVEDQISEAYPAEPEAIVEQFDLKEQQTHEKENHVTKRPKKSSPVRVRQASPPSAESRSTDSLSSLPDADPVVEIQPEPEPEPEPEPMPEPMPVEEPKVVLAAPPGLPSSSENTTSRLLRLMNLSEGSGQGSVPAPAPQEEAPAPLTNWQSLLGLAPPVPQPEPVIKTQRLPSPPPGLNPFDDDLGFDPFNESTKGLAKLLEEERVRHPPVSSMFNAHRPSLQDLWAPVTSFGGLGPSRTQQPFGNHTPFDMFGLTSTPQLNGNYSNGGHHPPPSQYNDFPMHQSHHQVHSHSSYAPPPGLAPPGRHAPVSQPQSITEWQEGLKALLPNVNVRFASDLEQQASQRWQSSSSGSFGSLHPSILPHSVPPPPGFSIPNR